jgi:hypothetical protein
LARHDETGPTSPLVPNPARKARLFRVQTLSAEGGASRRNLERSAVFRRAAVLGHVEYLRDQSQAFGASGSQAGVDALRAGSIYTTNDKRKSIRLDVLDWRCLGVEDRSELWMLQQWNFIREGLFEHRSQGTTEALRRVAPLLRSWAEVNLSAESLRTNGHLAWHDHTTALRSISFVHYVTALAVTGASVQAEFPLLYEFVSVHLRVLIAEDFYSKRTNHGFDQAFALYLLANAFDFGPVARVAREIGRARLLDEASVAFNQEGIHIENSPGYHPLMLAKLLQARALLKAFGDDFGSIDIDGILDKGLAFLSHALRPDGSLPLFGDTQTHPVRLNLGEAETASNAKFFRYASSGGRKGERPPHSMRVFPGAGYAFTRNRWGGPEDFTDTVHLSMKCGFLRGCTRINLKPHQRFSDEPS